MMVVSGFVSDGRCAVIPRASCPQVSVSRCGLAAVEELLAALVAFYVRHRLPETVRERLAWRQLRSDVALRRAAYGRDSSGGKHPHQFRLGDVALCAAVELAEAQREQFFAANDFETILALARDIQCDVHGLGPMWSYDFAERLGAHRGIAPCELVHVQRGALAGARNLGLAIVAGTIRHSSLPQELRVLDAGDVEDFLCINKHLVNSAMLR